MIDELKMEDHSTSTGTTIALTYTTSRFASRLFGAGLVINVATHTAVRYYTL